MIDKIRCNNAGENKKMEELCVEQGLGIKFEYTIVMMPQQNGRIERNVTTL